MRILLAVLILSISLFGYNRESLTKKAEHYKKSLPNSVHDLLECSECHTNVEDGDFSSITYKDIQKNTSQCIECHTDVEPFHKAFKESFHAKKIGETFKCSSCHNPHTKVLPEKPENDKLKVIAAYNDVCIECHTNGAEFKRYTRAALPNLNEVHSFLPSQDLHWKHVRCVECHTPTEDKTSHNITDRLSARNECSDCHSENTIVAAKLYTDKSDDGKGFTNSGLMKDVYIIGANRNIYIDYFFGLALIGTILGVSLHGLGRFITRRKGGEYEVHKEYLYTINVRIWHWINALLFIILIATGISMHFSTLIPFEESVIVHNFAGMLLTVAYVGFFIMNIADGNMKQYIPPFKNFYTRMFNQAKYYIYGIFKGEDHPYHTSKEHKFNPLQQITYLKVMYFAVPVVVITGVMLLEPSNAPETILGYNGVWLVAIIHYIFAGFLTLFMLGHIYLATTGDKPLFLLKGMIDGFHYTLKKIKGKSE